ncbi:MAG TPA: hypothetical protein VNK24_09050 [Elusimicrobiota bacterium]|nr:hypothetical protein [Elusimicrobiota bacterium]
MKKIISGVLAALIAAPSAAFAQAAAEFSVQADQARAVPLSAALGPSAPDFSPLSTSGLADFSARLPTDSDIFPATLGVRSETTVGRVPLSAPGTEPRTAAAPPIETALPAQELSRAAAPESSVAAARVKRISARAKLAQAGYFFKSRSSKDIMSAQERQDAFWAGAGLAARAEAASPVEAPAASKFEKSISRLRTSSSNGPRSALAAAAVVPLIPAKAVSVAARFAPYLKIGGILLAAHLANRLIKRGIDKAGSKNSWPQDKISLYKSVSTITTWGLGVLFSLPILGVTLNHIVAGAGVTGVLVSIAAGDVINNFFEAGRVLLARPFKPGNHIKVGSQDYQVGALGWHDLRLAGADGAETIMPYTTLSGSVVTVARKDAPSPVQTVSGGRAGLKILAGIIDSIKEDLPAAPKKSVLKDAAVYLAAAAAAYLRFFHPIHLLAPVLPGLMAVAIGGAAMVTSRIARPIMERIGARFGWSDEKTLVVKGLFQAVLWLLAGGLALKSIGTSWGALGASLGFVSLGVGLVTQNIISGFWRWFLVRFGRAFGFNCSLRIGDSISSNGVRGVVSDINFYYIVLALASGEKAYVHYSIAFPFTKFPSSQEPNAGK